MRMRDCVWTAAVAGLLCATSALGEAPEQPGERRQYTYTWLFGGDDAMRPRGGTTRGPDVTLARAPVAAWEALREPGLSALERDRRAILAMAGPYRASFDFIETVGFTADFTPDRPYQSWGTEYVYVVADEPRFISLQHVIVMFFENDDGEVSGPAVVKHWRQDWRHEDRQLNVYAGHGTWARKRLSSREVRGSWSQAVFQVDDSPRYEAIGRWRHDGNYSSWESGETWRPLPRREFSVRDDYHVLVGTNRHTITPAGWIHEEDNLKLALNDAGEPRASTPYLAREAGLNRYERIVDHDFSAGDAYWEKTAPFWAEVRAAWTELLDRRERVTLSRQVDGKSLIQVMFERAGALQGRDGYDAAAERAFIDATLERYLQ